MKKKAAILIVDDEDKIRKVLKINLQQLYSVFLAKNGIEAQHYLENENIDLVITDLKMPGEINGLKLLEFVQKEFQFIPVIIITAFGTIENAVQAMKKGAYDYILKPIKIAELTPLIEKALKFGHLVQENTTLKAQIKKYKVEREIITANQQMRAILSTIKDVAQTNATILIQGESGTGKQLAAEYAHYTSPRANNPFIEINCGAIPKELMESELFGHEKGAFTGAVRTKKGKFELANEGTLFLDEIGELPVELQVKLLHILENQKFTRVGGTNYIVTDVRIIAATNRNLSQMVKEGAFRQDLFYRLKVVFIQIPPLRERKEDIPVLSHYFLNKHKRLNIKGIQDLSISDEAMDALINYPWPGNIRELENVIQQTLIFTRDKTITINNLPKDINTGLRKKIETKDDLQLEKKRLTQSILRDIEYNFLKRLLSSTSGNISKAAKRSGYDRRQIQNLIKKHNINIENFKK